MKAELFFSMMTSFINSNCDEGTAFAVGRLSGDLELEHMEMLGLFSDPKMKKAFLEGKKFKLESDTI